MQNLYPIEKQLIPEEDYFEKKPKSKPMHPNEGENINASWKAVESVNQESQSSSSSDQEIKQLDLKAEEASHRYFGFLEEAHSNDE
jgi:hypothetical protein